MTDEQAAVGLEDALELARGVLDPTSLIAHAVGTLAAQNLARALIALSARHAAAMEVVEAAEEYIKRDASAYVRLVDAIDAWRAGESV